MFLLRTLGSVQLVQVNADGEQALATHAKRLALLMFLARGGPGQLLRRDTLLGLLWPDSDQSHGRGALRQALTGLRKQLGPDAIIAQGEEEVGLAPGMLTCDATEFEQACGRGQHADACALYRGDFATGFHVTGVGPEFDQWMDLERTRLRLLALRAGREASAAAERAGRAAEAITLARWSVQLAPDDEAGVVHLIGLLDRAGDRSAALAAYQALERHLAAEYSATPSPETRALIEAVRLRNDPRVRSPGERRAGLAPGPAPPPVRPARRRLLVAGLIGAIVTSVFLVALAWVRQPRLPSPSLLAVVPFRVSAADESLRWLAEGMVDLLSIRLSGVEGLEVAEPSRPLAVWRQEMASGSNGLSDKALARIASLLGAGRVVQGSVSGTTAGIVLTAWVQAMPEGRIVARASASGSPDSLQTLIDQLAIQLIGQSASLESNRLGPSTSTSLPAIRAFLAGRAAFRTGRMEVALQHFLQAVQTDSDFAVAALDLYRTTFWANGRATGGIGERRALARRDRLSPPDRAFLDVMQQQGINAPVMFAKWDTVLTAYPDRPECWYGLGVAYYRWGQLAGIPDWTTRAGDAFRRGWQLDSMFERKWIQPGAPPSIAEPMRYMVELSHMRGDTAEVRQLVTRVNAADSSSDLARAARWHLAQMEGDSARRRFWEGIETASQRSTMFIALFIGGTGIGLEDQPRIAAADSRRLRVQDPGYSELAAWVSALNMGRPSEVPPIRGGDPLTVRKKLRSRIRDAMSWEGDSAAAAEAVRLLARQVDAPAHEPNAIRAKQQDICTLGQWYLAHADLSAGDRASRRLHAAAPLEPGGKETVAHRQYVELCVALLDATLAASRDSPPAARVAIAAADSLARTFIFQVCCADELSDANLILAALWERAGDLPKALQALRRRSESFGRAPLYMTSFLREEGRLAALTGDTLGAILAYRRYLVYRRDPAPSLRPAAEEVRRELAALVGR